MQYQHSYGGPFAGVRQREDTCDMLAFNTFIGNLLIRLDNDERAVVIMRGIAGAGKTTAAQTIENECSKNGYCAATFSGDAYFAERGLNFVHTALEQAHNECKRRFDQARRDPNGPRVLVVDNTNIFRNHYEPYIVEDQGWSTYFVTMECWEMEVCLWMGFRSRTPMETVIRNFEDMQDQGWDDAIAADDEHNVGLVPLPLGWLDE